MLTLSKQELADLVKEASAAGASIALAQFKGGCPYDKDCPCDTDTHREDHDWIKDSRAVTKRLADIKWGAISKLVGIVVVAAALFIGAAIADKMGIPRQ